MPTPALSGQEMLARVLQHLPQRHRVGVTVQEPEAESELPSPIEVVAMAALGRAMRSRRLDDVLQSQIDAAQRDQGRDQRRKPGGIGHRGELRDQEPDRE
jgi:hypothetical protein